jgi:NhaA family Na+:H+ antiporter
MAVSEVATSNGSRLMPPVSDMRDHILGPSDADITLVEYGSYACPRCRLANERIANVRDKVGDRMRYVFRHRPLRASSLARRAAELRSWSSMPEVQMHSGKRT